MSKVEMGENLSQKDISGPEQEKQELGLELVKNEQLDNVVDAANELDRKMKGDLPVTDGDVSRLEEALKFVKVNFYGDKMSIDEIKKIPDLKENMELWEGIENGEIDNSDSITYITKDIARTLFGEARKRHYGSLSFKKLKVLSDDTANEIFNLASGMGLYFDSSDLNHLSDETIDTLCVSRVILVSLKYVDNLSDNAIRMLAESDKIWYLSDKTKKRIDEYLAKNKK